MGHSVLLTNGQQNEGVVNPLTTSHENNVFSTCESKPNLTENDHAIRLLSFVIREKSIAI